MTRGKYAARSENRTSAELQAEVARLTAELKSAKESASETEDRLKLEIGYLRTNILAEASKLAAPEIKNHIDRVNEEHKKAGVSVEGMRVFMGKMDRFAFNACRYLSMTTGNSPSIVMDQVLTWITDKETPTVVNVDSFLVSNGLPRRGWMSWAMEWGFKSQRKQHARAVRSSGMAPLDYVEENPDKFPQVHPDYDPRWYRQWTDALRLEEDAL